MGDLTRRVAHERDQCMTDIVAVMTALVRAATPRL